LIIFGAPLNVIRILGSRKVSVATLMVRGGEGDLT